MNRLNYHLQCYLWMFHIGTWHQQTSQPSDPSGLSVRRPVQRLWKTPGVFGSKNAWWMGDVYNTSTRGKGFSWWWNGILWVVRIMGYRTNMAEIYIYIHNDVSEGGFPLDGPVIMNKKQTTPKELWFSLGGRASQINQDFCLQWFCPTARMIALGRLRYHLPNDCEI